MGNMVYADNNLLNKKRVTGKISVTLYFLIEILLYCHT